MSTDCANASAAGAGAAAAPAAASPAGGLAPYAVLYVDDEEQALKYLKKAFGKSFEVLTATSVDEGLTILEAQHARIGVVLTDHRMPGKTGVELLARVKKSWPAITRIIVTAYADMESAIGAVNSGSVYKYLTKPIDLAQTKQVLIEAMRSFVEARDRDAVLSETGDLLQRAIVADRVRSAATMAHGVSHHVRNSLTAVNCFFEEFGDRLIAAGGGGEDEYLEQLRALADQERVRLVGMIREVEARGARQSFRFDEQLDLAELVTRAVAAVAGQTANVRVEVPAGAASVAVDAAAVVRMLGALIVHADRYSPKGSTVRVVADGLMPYWGTAAARLRILGDGPAWHADDVAAFFTPFSITSKAPNEIGLELLDAFQTALGHEGDIIAHPAPPAGPGFEVRLPLNPAAVRRPALLDAAAASPARAAAMVA